MHSISLDAIAASGSFTALANIDGIRVDLRYASTDNFVARNVYAGFDCEWLHNEAAHALARAVSWLTVHSPTVKLCVLDALRPQRVQEQLWASLEGTPLTQYLAPPTIGSLHSFGMAIDVTLLDETGRELDMGTGFDAMTPLSHPEFESMHLASGALSQTQIDNRQLLRTAMTQAGFFAIDTEWWHFDATRDRERVRATYLRVI